MRSRSGSRMPRRRYGLRSGDGTGGVAAAIPVFTGAASAIVRVSSEAGAAALASGAELSAVELVSPVEDLLQPAPLRTSAAAKNETRRMRESLVPYRSSIKANVS